MRNGSSPGFSPSIALAATVSVILRADATEFGNAHRKGWSQSLRPPKISVVRVPYTTRLRHNSSLEPDTLRMHFGRHNATRNSPRSGDLERLAACWQELRVPGQDVGSNGTLGACSVLFVPQQRKSVHRQGPQLLSRALMENNEQGIQERGAHPTRQKGWLKRWLRVNLHSGHSFTSSARRLDTHRTCTAVADHFGGGNKWLRGQTKGRGEYPVGE